MVFGMVLCRVMWPNQENLRRFTFLPTRALVFQQGSPPVVSHIRLSCVQYTKYRRANFVSNVPTLACVEEDGYSECSAEFKPGFEADVSALPDGVKS